MGEGRWLKARGWVPRASNLPSPLVAKGMRSEGGSKCLSLEGLGALLCYHLGGLSPFHFFSTSGGGGHTAGT